MNIDTWTSGYKVRAFDWIDGENIYLNIEYFVPGSSLSQPPAMERSFLIPKDEERILEGHLDSVVVGLMNRAKGGIPMAKAAKVDEAIEKSFNTWMSDTARAAMRHCEPDGMYEGADGAKKLARECGVALADFEDYGVKNIRSTYGAICVIAYNLKPPIDSRTWNLEMLGGYKRELDRRGKKVAV